MIFFSDGDGFASCCGSFRDGDGNGRGDSLENGDGCGVAEYGFGEGFFCNEGGSDGDGCGAGLEAHWD